MIDLVDAMIARGAMRVSVTVAGVTCSVEGLRPPEAATPPRSAAARDAIEEAKRRAADVERVLFPPEPEE